MILKCVLVALCYVAFAVLVKDHSYFNSSHKNKTSSTQCSLQASYTLHIHTYSTCMDVYNSVKSVHVTHGYTVAMACSFVVALKLGRLEHHPCSTDNSCPTCARGLCV